MRQKILDFSEQLNTELPVENLARWTRKDKFIVCGMGGSSLAAGLLKVYQPGLDLLIHRDYGLPRVPRYFLEESMLIISSYSGEVEEVIDTFGLARKRGLDLAVITSGGTLLELAQAAGVPHIILPSGWPPRLAVGWSLVAMATLVGDERLVSRLKELIEFFQPAALEPTGQELASLLKGKLPLVYASTVNLPLAYNWKINLNETGKTAAFYNVLPEANHNELEASDERFFYLLLRDDTDHARIKRRFDCLIEMFKRRNIAHKEIFLTGDPVEKIFSSVLLAIWTAFHLALSSDSDPLGVPIIEEFKKQLIN